MTTSWIDLVGTVLLVGSGLYNLRRGLGRLRRTGRGWRGDFAALLTALLGGMLGAMGVVLLLYSSTYAFLIE